MIASSLFPQSWQVWACDSAICPCLNWNPLSRNNGPLWHLWICEWGMGCTLV